MRTYLKRKKVKRRVKREEKDEGEGMSKEELYNNVGIEDYRPVSGFGLSLTGGELSEFS